MKSHHGFKLAGSTAIAALSLASMLAVSGCEERPYPQPAKSYAPPPSAPPADLAGAPSNSSYSPPAPTVYTAPPAETARAYGAPVYSSPQPQPYTGEGLVAMAPIPNPGDGDGYGAPRHHRVHGTYYTGPVPVDQGSAPAPVHHKPVYVAKPVTPAPKYAKAPTPPAYKATVKPAAPVYKPAPAPTYAKAPVPAPKPNGYVAKGAALGAAAGAATAVVAKDAHAVAKGTATAAKTTYAAKAVTPPGATPAAKLGTKTVAVAAGAAAGAVVAAKDAVAVAKNAATSAKSTYTAAKTPAPAAVPTASGADRSTRLASLQSALTDAISKGAKLTAPARFTANQPADVTLTVPATFAATLRDEAGKDGLSDAAASVNLTAVLSGDGFAVTPDETQSQPVTLGQITEFHWTVTAQPGAKGPLHADVGADMLGGGSDTLALGSVQKAAGMGIKPTPKVVGATLLVLIAALIVAWLARGRGGPSRPASARRASRNARNRPLDMGMSVSEPSRSEPTNAEPAGH